MPAMNGLEAARALKRVTPTIPIIMFSDYAEVLAEMDVQHAGMRKGNAESRRNSAPVALRKPGTWKH